MTSASAEEERKLTLVSQNKEGGGWIKATSDDLNFDISTAMDEQVTQPIKTRKQLDDRIRLLAVHILKWNDNNKIIKKTVAQYFIEIKAAAIKLGYTKDEIRQIAEEIFRQYNISESHIRKVIPHELKDQSKTNIRYIPNLETKEYDESALSTEDIPSDTEIQLKNAIERIKDLELKVRGLNEQLSNSIMIGQETRIYKGHVSLDREQELPVIVAINLKDNKLEYIEIDTEAIRQAHEVA